MPITVDLGMRLDVAPPVKIIRKLFVSVILRDTTPPSQAALLCRQLVAIYSDLLHLDYPMFWEKSTNDWKWFEKKMMQQKSRISDAKESNAWCIVNFAEFAKAFVQIVALSEDRETPFPVAVVPSELVTDELHPPQAKRPKFADSNPRSKRLHGVDAAIESKAQVSLLWLPFYHSADPAYAVESFLQTLFAINGMCTNASLSVAIADLIARLLRWVVEFRLEGCLNSASEKLASHEDVSTTFRLMLLSRIPNGYPKSVLVDRLLRYFDYASPLGPTDIERPVSVDKLTQVLFRGAPFKIVQKNKESAHVGMKFSAYDQALCLHHLFFSLFDLHQPELVRNAKLLESACELFRSKIQSRQRNGNAAASLLDDLLSAIRALAEDHE